MADILFLPPDHASLKGLPRGIGDLCKVIQGLLIHDSSSQGLYGKPPDSFRVDRTTKPVLERIEMALASHPMPLSKPRPPFERQVGTCRDYAAMLCSLARASGSEARVRCGFAWYLAARGFEDHWVTEHRGKRPSEWLLADAQLDEEHRAHFGISFEIGRVPRSQFLTAGEAWRQWRDGHASASSFGHGVYRGERLLLVNVVRDALAKSDVLVSSWDRWRELGDLSKPLDAVVLEMGDRVVAGDRNVISRIALIPPFDLLHLPQQIHGR
jgi:hypothetical protein